jgi:hypothetical protein
MKRLKDPEEVLEDYDLTISLSNDDWTNTYPIESIKVDKAFYTVYELKRKYEKDVPLIILDSSFQRDNVWNQKQKNELIESVLMGLPLPIFYFNQDKYGRLIVVDGRQRLTTLFEYIDNRFILNNLKILKGLNDKNFKQLTPLMQSKLEDYQVQAHVIMPPTPDRVKFDIFDRVNRAGTQLNKQEIRNALYQGKATKLLLRISKSNEFKLASGNSFLDEVRMKDRYLILRFIAFYLYFNENIITKKGERYEYTDIDDLLGTVMEQLGGWKDAEIEMLEKTSIIALGNSAHYLGGEAFRLNVEGKRTPINMNVFEVITYIMSKVPQNLSNSDRIIKIISGLKKEEAFIDSIGNRRDSYLKIKTRFDLAEKAVLEILNDK